MDARIEESNRYVKGIGDHDILKWVSNGVLTQRTTHATLYPRNIVLPSLIERNILPEGTPGPPVAGGCPGSLREGITPRNFLTEILKTPELWASVCRLV